MPKIKISYTAPGADVVTAKIDESPVSFSGTAKAGQADVNVGAGNHRLRYTVEGLPGTSYTIKIEGSTPDKSITDTIGPTGLAAGSIPFVLAGAMAIAAAGVVAAAAVATAAVAVRRRSARKKAATKGKARSRKTEEAPDKPAAKRAKRPVSKKSAAKKRTPSKKATASRKATGRASKKEGRR